VAREWDERDDVARALTLLRRAGLTPPVSTVDEAFEADQRIALVSSRNGLTPADVERIEAVLADVPHRIDTEPTGTRGVLYRDREGKIHLG
jgi:hypothetical protein